MILSPSHSPSVIKPSQAMGAARREPGGGETPMRRARAVRDIPFMLGGERQIQHKQTSRTDTIRRGMPIFGNTTPYSCVFEKIKREAGMRYESGNRKFHHPQYKRLSSYPCLCRQEGRRSGKRRYADFDGLIRGTGRKRTANPKRLNIGAFTKKKSRLSVVHVVRYWHRIFFL